MAFLPFTRACDVPIADRPYALSDERLSTTIGFARLVLIIGLVCLHYGSYPGASVSPFDGVDVHHNSLATFINSFVLFFFFSVVPVLSVISGWLFFNLPVQQARATLARRIRRRFTSLYLPLVFWNTLFLGLLALFHAWRPDSTLFASINIDFDRARLLDYFNAVFGITAHPVAFQFWFVRDLFVAVLLSPLLWLALRKAQLLGLAVLALAWISGSHLLVFFRSDVVLFFYVGGMLRIRGTPLWIGPRMTWILLGSYVLLVALRALAPSVIDMSMHRPEWLTAATRATRLLGVPACWGLLLRLAQHPSGMRISRYGGLSLFLHAAHFPLLLAVKLVLWRWVPATTDGWLLLHYLASVAVTVAIGLSAGLLLVKYAPRVFALMNGGRLIPAARGPAETTRTPSHPLASPAPEPV